MGTRLLSVPTESRFQSSLGSPKGGGEETGGQGGGKGWGGSLAGLLLEHVCLALVCGILREGCTAKCMAGSSHETSVKLLPLSEPQFPPL